jgi:hypothetical protein
MQDQPRIKTALPKRRYQIGDYAATVLGEIEADDGRDYRWLMAFVPMGKNEPSLYVCCEPAPAERRADGDWDIRIVSKAMTDILDTADHWGDLDTFCEQAIDLARQVLGLASQEAFRLS